MSDNDSAARGPDQRQMQRLRHAKRLHQDRFLQIPGVHSVGIGYKQVGGQRTGDLAIIVYVDEKLPRPEVEPARMLPPEVRFHWDTSEREEVVPVDVIARARPVPYPHIGDGDLRTHVRPVPGGRSIRAQGSATLGGWVWDDLEDQVVLLSNEHVLGNVAGTQVFQPSSSSDPDDVIATVTRAGDLDAAIATPLDTGDALFEIEGIGPAVFEVTEATLGMAVEKVGRTTEHTTGEVVAVEIAGASGSLNDFEVDPVEGKDLDGVERFAYFGDSGSLIVEQEHPDGATWQRVVGLLWGGNPPAGNSFNHQIEDVFEDLDLAPLCTGSLAQFSDALFARAFAGTAQPVERVGTAQRVERVGTAQPVERAALQRPPMVARPPRRPRAPKPSHRGLTRDVERRLKGMGRGSEVVEAVHRHRVGLVRLVADRETRRALEPAVAPFMDGAWTADELLERELSGEDVERFRRAVSIVARQRPELRELVSLAERVLDGAEGQSFARLLR